MTREGYVKHAYNHDEGLKGVTRRYLEAVVVSIGARVGLAVGRGVAIMAFGFATR